MTTPETCREQCGDPLHDCGKKLPCGIHSDEAKAKRRAKSDAYYARKGMREDIYTLRLAASILRNSRRLADLADRVDEAAARWKQELEDGK